MEFDLFKAMNNQWKPLLNFFNDTQQKEYKKNGFDIHGIIADQKSQQQQHERIASSYAKMCLLLLFFRIFFPSVSLHH